MGPVTRLAAVLIIVATLTTTSSPAGAADRDDDRRPNVIIVLADDLGWAELGCYGNRFNETPHLDRMAERGTRFSHAYSAAPVCSPFRASLLTGQWPVRVGITDYLRPTESRHLPLELTTIAEALQSTGYATGLIGKWHLTGYRTAGVKNEVLPDRHGFDEVIVSENASIGGVSYFHPYHFNRGVERRLFPAEENPTAAKQIPNFDVREFLVDRLNVEAVEFIERHQDRPFLLYKSHYAVHTSLNAPEQRIAKYRDKPGAATERQGKPNNIHLAGQLEAIDEGVGMIFEKLEQLRLSDNTIVIFMSDNGGESNVTSNAPLRAGKSTLYEGGIRVPLIVDWPGRGTAGSVCRKPVCSVDIYPTLLAAAGLKADSAAEAEDPIVDGKSLLPLIDNPRASLDRQAIYWHYPLEKPHFLGGRSAGAVRQGDWKLIEFFDTGQIELYNLPDDPSETNDLANTYPALAKILRKDLAEWRTATGASIPAGQKVER